MSGFIKSELIWLNGGLLPWDEARIHVMAHGLHYGTGVFEGVRAYETADGASIFRLDAHIERLAASALVYDMWLPYTHAELVAATADVVRRNGLRDAYIRPIAFFDAFTYTLLPGASPVSVAIIGMPTGAYHGQGRDRGVRVTISTVRRFDAQAIPASCKSCGQYVNSIRATQDAARRGFDEAILLNTAGEVAEGAGENVFLVKDGRLVTNDDRAGILMGITRESILEIARDLGIPVEIGTLQPRDLLQADELFFTGTAVEVTPIREVDGTAIGSGAPGPITRRLQATYFDVVRGRHPHYRHWLTPIPAQATTR